MSMLADIQSTLSSPLLKEKLTLTERAELLIEICESLEWTTYDITDTETGWTGRDLEKAKKSLENY